MLFVEELLSDFRLFDGKVAISERHSEPNGDRFVEERPRFVRRIAGGMKLLAAGEKVGNVLPAITVSEVLGNEYLELPHLFAVEV